MRFIAFLCAGLLALCAPATAKRDAGAPAKNVSSVKDSAATCAPAVKDTIPVAVPPATDTAASPAAAAPQYNDTAVVQRILNECGLLAVKVGEVTEWDSAGRAVALDLSNKDLSKDGITALPAAICSLTALRTLTAKNNSITAVPVELFTLTNLQKLDLASNKISFIPPSIAGLENLETLDLRYNGFGFLPPEIGRLKKLVSLQLWGNKMVELEPAVTQLPALKELFLKDNRLTTLPEGITRMKSLVYIDLQGNAICKPSPKIDAWLKQNDKRYREAQRCR
jgi:hypothetical protein